MHQRDAGDYQPRFQLPPSPTSQHTQAGHTLRGTGRVQPVSLYQQAIGTRSEKRYQRPATLRSQVFLGGAILGNRARRPVLYIAQSWGGAGKHKPLIDKVLEWRKRTSPKLPPDHSPPNDNELKNAA